MIYPTSLKQFIKWTNKEMNRESALYEQLSIIDQVLSMPVDGYGSVYPELTGFLEEWLRTNRIPLRTSLLKHQTHMVIGMMAHFIRMSRGFVWQNQILRGKLGIIGDPPGTGKTLSVLAFLSALPGIVAAEAALEADWVGSGSGTAGTAGATGATGAGTAGAGTAGAAGAGTDRDVSEGAATVTVTVPVVPPPLYRLGELDVNSNRYMYSNEIHTLTDSSACNLVVVPPALISHWRHEVATHTTLTPFVIDGRRVLRNRTTATQMVTSPFVLCTNKTYRYVLDFAEAHGIRWKHVFLDDAAGIVLTNNDVLPTFEFLWLISSNWMPFVLKSTHIHPSNIAYMRSRMTLSVEGERWLAEVLAQNQEINTSVASSAFFRGVIPYTHKGRSALVLRNSADTLSVGGATSFELTERVVQCMPTVSIAQLTPAFLATRGEGLVAQIPTLFQAIGLHALSVHELQMHYRERQELLDRKLDNDCSICLEATQNRTVLSCCMTPFCGSCILRHTVSRPLGHAVCPTCRTALYIPNILHVPHEGTAIVPSSITPLRTKQEELLEILRTSVGATATAPMSALVYSQFENTFYQVQPYLAQMGIVAEQLTMPMSRYQNTLRGYQDGRIHILFVNDSNLLRGQNLQRTTHLVFFCEAPFYDTQQNLVHAALRLGRTAPLTLLRLSSAL